MDKFSTVGELKTQNSVENAIKALEAEKIATLEEKLKGLKLAYSTDLQTVPVTNVDPGELTGTTVLSSENLWDHHKIDLKTPIILDRSKNVIAGPMQYFEAKDKGLKTIDAVYIDSLKGKTIYIDTLRQQFQDEKVSTGFAYSLYAAVSHMYEVISYEDFVENIDELFSEDLIRDKISNYISALDDEFGV